MKSMTIWMPDELAEDLAVVADCDGESLSDAVRAAMTAWVRHRRSDPNFQAALRRRIEADQRLLKDADDDAAVPQ